MKVGVFIVGAPKAGTTSLYHYLNEHPNIVMSIDKEPNYFSSEAIKKQKLYYKKKYIETLDQYHSLFTNIKENMIFGEGSVSYLFYNNVASNIKSYNKDAKIIMIFRNPIERAFSHYLMDLRLGLISEKFEDIINKKSTHPNAKLYYQQYVGLGKYFEQLMRYREIFDLNNILIIDYEDLKYNTSKCVKKTYDFLGVEKSHTPNIEVTHNRFKQARNSWVKLLYSSVTIRDMSRYIIPNQLKDYLNNMLFQKDKKPVLNKKTEKKLRMIFKEDIVKLSDILEKDFIKWIK